MPHRIKQLKQRLVIAHLMTKLMQIAANSYLTSKRFGSSADDVMLCVAIFIGQAEGKPMNPNKLAGYVGIPRATVVRKIQALEKRGLIEVGARGECVLPIDVLNTVTIGAAVMASTNAIVDAASKLSKLDN